MITVLLADGHSIVRMGFKMILGQKLGLSSKPELFEYAARHGLLGL